MNFELAVPNDRYPCNVQTNALDDFDIFEIDDETPEIPTFDSAIESADTNTCECGGELVISINETIIKCADCGQIKPYEVKTNTRVIGFPMRLIGRHSEKFRRQAFAGTSQNQSKQQLEKIIAEYSDYKTQYYEKTGHVITQDIIMTAAQKYNELQKHKVVLRSDNKRNAMAGCLHFSSIDHSHIICDSKIAEFMQTTRQNVTNGISLILDYIKKDFITCGEIDYLEVEINSLFKELSIDFAFKQKTIDFVKYTDSLFIAMKSTLRSKVCGATHLITKFPLDKICEVKDLRPRTVMVYIDDIKARKRLFTNIY